MTSTPRDDEAIWRAELAEMPLRVILAYLRERGHAVGDKPLEWWQYHHCDCGTRYRGCSPECPKDVFERTGLWIGPAIVRDRLPPGYPPRAEDDVPFDALEDTRS